MVDQARREMNAYVNAMAMADGFEDGELIDLRSSSDEEEDIRDAQMLLAIRNVAAGRRVNEDAPDPQPVRRNPNRGRRRSHRRRRRGHFKLTPAIFRGIGEAVYQLAWNHHHQVGERD